MQCTCKMWQHCTATSLACGRTKHLSKHVCECSCNQSAGHLHQCVMQDAKVQRPQRCAWACNTHHWKSKASALRDPAHKAHTPQLYSWQQLTLGLAIPHSITRPGDLPLHVVMYLRAKVDPQHKRRACTMWPDSMLGAHTSTPPHTQKVATRPIMVNCGQTSTQCKEDAQHTTSPTIVAVWQPPLSDLVAAAAAAT